MTLKFERRPDPMPHMCLWTAGQRGASYVINLDQGGPPGPDKDGVVYRDRYSASYQRPGSRIIHLGTFDTFGEAEQTLSNSARTQ